MEQNNRLIKHNGQVFTPNFLVRNILDFASYFGEGILHKHVIDNSCGNGAFLCEIVDRYCKTYISVNNGIEGLKAELEKFVHGIEIDVPTYNSCLFNLNSLATTYGLENVNWDISNEDALNVTKYDHQMDFVVGNPPYVRVHNLEDKYDNVKMYSFAQDGMTDLYLVFYELGLQMLNDTGKLCYITPNSWLSSLAALQMRRYIMNKRTVSGLIDLGHYQAFGNATTYTMIALFDKNHQSDNITYYSYSPEKQEKVFVDNISYDDIAIGNSFYVASHKDLTALRNIKTMATNAFCVVKNGFATLADKVFILDVDFNELTIPVLKASTGKWHRGFFPYDREGKPLPYEKIFCYPSVAAYLNGNKSHLLKKKSEKDNPVWYLYGRTQALKDVFVSKFAINTLVKDVSSIKLTEVPAGSGLYSGLYILTKFPYNVIESIVKSEDFVNYLRMLKKYKSGGYYTFNSKDLEQFINVKLLQYLKSKNYVSNDKLRLFESNFRFV